MSNEVKDDRADSEGEDSGDSDEEHRFYKSIIIFYLNYNFLSLSYS